MYLLIDAGNTRIKFGCHDGDRWLVRDVSHGDAALALPIGFVPARIVIANVAGPSVAQRLSQQFKAWQGRIEWLIPTATRCGLSNRYEPVESLGADRWAAAIAAWQLTGKACVVVSAGTATTIDIIEAGGVFAGGCIVPGLALMKASLASGTANLPAIQSADNPVVLEFVPRNTYDAVTTGCLHAQLGAVDRMARALPPGSPIVMTGGAATQLLPYLGTTAICVPWLVLEGLLQIATDR